MSLLNICPSDLRLLLFLWYAVTGGKEGHLCHYHTECCVFIPDKPANISSSLVHMKSQGNALCDVVPSLGDL